MPLTERSRSALYQGLIVVIEDDQAVQEMLSSFPGREADEPASKEFVRAELAVTTGELRTEMAAMGSALRAEMAAMGSALRAEMAAMERTLRTEIQALRVEVHELFRRQTVWTIATLIACLSIQTALLALAIR